MPLPGAAGRDSAAHAGCRGFAGVRMGKGPVCTSSEESEKELTTQ